MSSISVAFSVGVLFYTLSIYNTKPPYQYMWQTQDISPYPGPASHFSVATFCFPKLDSSPHAFVVWTDVFTGNTTAITTVDIRSLIISDTSVYMAYNWTGGNWTLRFGIEIGR